MAFCASTSKKNTRAGGEVLLNFTCMNLPICIGSTEYLAAVAARINTCTETPGASEVKISKLSFHYKMTVVLSVHFIKQLFRGERKVHSICSLKEKKGYFSS